MLNLNRLSFSFRRINQFGMRVYHDAPGCKTGASLDSGDALNSLASPSA